MGNFVVSQQTSLHQNSSDDESRLSIFKLETSNLASTIFCCYETPQKTIQQINLDFPPGNARCVPCLLHSQILGTRAI